MVRYETILLALYAIALIVVVVEVSAFWGIAVTMMLLLMIVLIQKMDSEEKIGKLEKTRGKMINIITEKLDTFSNRIKEMDNNLKRNAFITENKILEIRHFSEVEMESNYRDLAKKIFDIENKLSSVKRTLGAAVGSMDERLKRFEREGEWSG